MKRILVALLFALALPAHAATTYFCNCTGTGADGACVNGSDGNTGATTLAGGTGPKKTLAAFKTVMAAAVPGDQLLLGKGCAWDAWATGTTVPRNGTVAAYKANPLIIGSFTPKQFSTSNPKPILNGVPDLGITYTITAITKANCAKVTAANALAGGDRVTIGAVTNMPEILGVNGAVMSGPDGFCPAALAPTGTDFYVDIDTTVFALAGTNGTAVKACAYNDTAGTCQAFNFYPTGGSAATAYGGYTIQDLDIRGADGQGGAVVIQNNASNITLQRLTISHIGGAVLCNANSTNGTPTNITLRNSAISYTQASGIGFFGCNNTLIENNTLDRTAYGPKTNFYKLRDHPLYVSGNEFSDATNTTYTTGVVIRGNTITNSALNQIANGEGTIGGAHSADPTKCNATILVGHARIRQWVVEGNRLIQATGTSGAGCYGIGIFPGNANGANFGEFERFYTIRGNLVVNGGNNQIDTRACTDCLIENNVLVRDELYDGATAISVTQSGITPPTYNNDRVKVRNNSIYMLGGTGAGVVGIDISGSGTGHEITNNLIAFGSGGGTRQCFGFALAASSYSTWNNNLCYNSTVWATGFSTKALFTASNPTFDTASLTTDPLLVALPTSPNYSMQIQTGSPAKNAGHATRYSRLAYQGYKAIGVRDIGAYEFGSNP